MVDFPWLCWFTGGYMYISHLWYWDWTTETYESLWTWHFSPNRFIRGFPFEKEKCARQPGSRFAACFMKVYAMFLFLKLQKSRSTFYTKSCKIMQNASGSFLLLLTYLGFKPGIDGSALSALDISNPHDLTTGALVVDIRLVRCQIKVSRSSWRSKLPCVQDCSDFWVRFGGIDFTTNKA